MTIPIQTPQIGATGVVKPPNFLDEIAPFLQAIAQQTTAQAQAENVRGLSEERRRKAIQDAQDLQAQADAAKAFYMHLSGAQETVKPTQPDKDGVMPHPGANETHPLVPRPDIVRSLSPAALEYYGKHLTDYNTNVTSVLQGTEAQARAEHEHAQAALMGDQAAAEQTTRDILTRYGDSLSRPGKRAQALTEIGALAGPEKANQVATMLNSAYPQGSYDSFVAPNGWAYIRDNKTGSIRPGPFVGQRVTNQLRMDAIRRQAQILVDDLKAQHSIAQLDIKGSRNPVLAQVLQTSRLLGIDAEAAANLLRSDPQQATQMLKTRFAHNFVGMLANSRSAANLLSNLAESYWAPGGSGVPLLKSADADREHLRMMLEKVANGQEDDLSKLGPGFAAAMAAWAADMAQQGQSPDLTGGAVPNPNAPPPNPMDWQGGVPKP